MKAKKRSLRRGSTMVEVVIVIVIFSMIVVATTTLVTQSIQVERSNLRSMEIAIYAENALDCFHYAEGDKGDLWGALKQVGFNCDDPDTATLEKGDYTITITSGDGFANTITITATASDGAIILYTLTGGR